MDPVTSARKHQFGSVSTPPSSHHHHESRKKPTSTCTSPSTSGKSLSLTSAWLVRSPATSPRDAAGSSASRRHKRSGSQSGHDLLKKILPPPEDAFDHSPAAKSGGQSDVGAKEEKLKRVVRRLHLRLTPRSSSGTTAGSETLGELSPKTSEVPTSNLAVVTSARESGDTNSKSTKREREDEDENEDQSRAEAKRARRETSTSGRKGILKNLKKERASNHKRSVRWAERLEDYNYPKWDLSDTDLSDLDSDLEDYDDDDDDEEDDAFPDNVHAHAHFIPPYYGSVASAHQHNQQFFAAVPPPAVPTLPNNWFTGFLSSLSSQDIRDLGVAYNAFYRPAIQPLQSPHPHTGTPRSNNQAPAGVWDYVRGEDGLPRAVFIPNHQHHWQEVPDLSASPDPSDQSLTPPSPAHDGVNKSPDENVNVVITDDECSEGGLSAEGSLFPGGPNTTGQLLEEGANPEPPFSSKRSSLNNGDCGEDTPSSTSEECSANGCSREKQYRTAARRRIGFSASREMAVKDGRDDGTEKFAGFEGTSGPASPLT